MIKYCTVLRISDGLPLSLSTDDKFFDKNDESSAKVLIKHLLQTILQLPKRICIYDDGFKFSIYCIHTDVVAFVAVCGFDHGQPEAFCFLEEIRKEFDMLYMASVVAAVRRPCAFTEFDRYMQNIMFQNNHPHTPHDLSLRYNYDSMRSDLALNPAAIINADSILPPPPPPPIRTVASYTAVNMSNGGLEKELMSKNKSEYALVVHLSPLDCVTKCFLVMATLAIFLDGYRAFSTISEIKYEDEISQNEHGAGFLIEGAGLLGQIYLINYYKRLWRVYTALCCLLVLFPACVLLSSIREIWLSLFYIFLSFTLAHFTSVRKFQKVKRKILV